jgi:nitric oxide synthase-interacting protein
MPTRKSKMPGGNMPLTYQERSTYAKRSNYGTSASRLGADSQGKFGDCCLGLSPAQDPVVTPSGHIYSREAIVSYLLTKTQELKDAREKYDAQLLADQTKETLKQKDIEEKNTQIFLLKDQGSIQLSKEKHESAFKHSLKRKIDVESKEEGVSKLQKTSYWLSEAQPQYTNESIEDEIRNNPPPARPSSPMSGNPLRLKDLTRITLNRDGGSGKSSLNSKCTCAVSNKVISTQPAIVIKKTGVVILEDVYNKIIKPSMVCPIKGKKFKEKDVLQLSKCASGFAASGKVTATKYRPTLT